MPPGLSCRAPILAREIMNLLGLAAISANDLWAVGMYYTGNSPNVLAQHWDGTAWTISTLESPPDNGELLAVSALSANNVWAAGYSGSATLDRALGRHNLVNTTQP